MQVFLAHQGGWDEILMVAAPVLVIAGLFILANSRAKRLASESKETDIDEADRPR